MNQAEIDALVSEGIAADSNRLAEMREVMAESLRWLDHPLWLDAPTCGTPEYLVRRIKHLLGQ